MIRKTTLMMLSLVRLVCGATARAGSFMKWSAISLMIVPPGVV
jgi:hypothetical protein